jgi:hypothetical protein
MNRKHGLFLAVALGLAAVAGTYAAMQTTDLGAQAASVSEQEIAAADKRLDEQEAALRRAARKRPPKLPKLPPRAQAPAAAPAAAGGNAPAPAAAPATAAPAPAPAAPAPAFTDDNSGHGSHDDDHADDLEDAREDYLDDLEDAREDAEDDD